MAKKWEDAKLITQRYRKYREHARFQQNVILSGDFINGLGQGLARLPSLDIVSMEGGWPHYVLATLHQHRFGPPLARTWDPFHLYPRAWYCGPSEEDFPDGACHYRIITTALVRTKKKIREFEVGRGSQLPCISPGVLQRRDYASYNIFGLDVGAVEGLQRLSLKIAQRSYGTSSNYVENIRGLSKPLASMKSLQRLDMGLPLDLDD